MDAYVFFLIVIFAFYFVVLVVVILRDIFFVKKENFRGIHTVGEVSGREIVERMLKDNDIDLVSINAKDRIIERYYYSPRRREIVMSAHACYNCGYYDVMRAASTAMNVVQHQEGYGMIDLYLRLAPMMEWIARLFPMIFIIGCFVVHFNPVLVICIILLIWALLLVFTLIMRHVDKDAAQRAAEWLLSHGLVPECDRKQINKIARYLTNYNLVLVLTAYFALYLSRFKFFSDQSV